MLTRRTLLFGLYPAVRLFSQQPPSFSTEVKVVNVLATVRDQKGLIVSDLTQSDFTLEEEGRPQQIKYFARETGLPLTLGLLVDTSLSQRRVLGEERSASYRFLDRVLRVTGTAAQAGKEAQTGTDETVPRRRSGAAWTVPSVPVSDDQAFIIHFDREAELLQDLTSSKQRLEKALTQLELPQQGGRGGGNPGGGGSYPGGRGGGGYPGGRGGGGPRSGGAGTVLYDAVLLASDELMRKQTGRKALILLTDGVDHGSKVTAGEAIQAAHRADTLVYSILFADEAAYGQMPMGRGGYGGRRGGGMPPQRMPQRQGEDGRKVLQRISKETGGGFFEVSKKLTIDQIYTRIQEELRSQYSLGYTPDPPNPPGAFRHITLKTTRPGLQVQSREGYYSPR